MSKPTELDGESRAIRWHRRFAMFTAVATLPLIFIGGLVTSKEAGLAVPDWPNSYGYNMFLFPPSMWVGNILYEHTHRLYASFVGLLTTILAVWTWRVEPRRWMRRLGLIAFFVVLLQGILGGLRVVLLQNQIGVVHACLAQLFFCLLVAFALFCSRWWKQTEAQPSVHARPLRVTALLTVAVIFGQLVLGAAMRHNQAGLAIPDFPLAYGRLLPPTDPAELTRINDERNWRLHLEPVTFGQIHLHFAHRVGALVVTAVVLLLTAIVLRWFDSRSLLARLVLGLSCLLGLQIVLGIATVLSGKAADVATAHVAVGALTLAVIVVIALVAFRSHVPLMSQAGEERAPLLNHAPSSPLRPSPGSIRS